MKSLKVDNYVGLTGSLPQNSLEELVAISEGFDLGLVDKDTLEAQFEEYKKKDSEGRIRHKGYLHRVPSIIVRTKEKLINVGELNLSKISFLHMTYPIESKIQNYISEYKKDELSGSFPKQDFLFMTEQFPQIGISKTRRLKILEMCLEGILKSNDSDKIVIFSPRVDYLKVLKRELLLSGIPVYMIDGSMSARKREDMINHFSNTDNRRIILASLRAFGEGINLSVANHAIFYDFWWNPQKMNQAIDRLYRGSQSKPVYIYYHSCPR